jgi:hypothetical protein
VHRVCSLLLVCQQMFERAGPRVRPWVPHHGKQTPQAHYGCAIRSLRQVQVAGRPCAPKIQRNLLCHCAGGFQRHDLSLRATLSAPGPGGYRSAYHQFPFRLDRDLDLFSGSQLPPTLCPSPASVLDFKPDFDPAVRPHAAHIAKSQVESP